MILAEPPSSPADLHFRLFGIPVRVHPWFWIISLFLGISGREPADPVKTILWVAVVFISILVHEMGHAIVQRRFGGRPWITLYSLGGLSSCGDCDRSPRSQILISLAGPGAGFLFAAALLLAAFAAGHDIFPAGSLDRESIERWLAAYPTGVLFFSVGWMTFGFEAFGSMIANDIMQDLLYVNIWWGLINLLPIYPLDGGHVARELMTLHDTHRGIVRSLWLSAAVAGAMALYGISRNSIFVAIMFGYLAYASYQTIRAYQGYRR